MRKFFFLQSLTGCCTTTNLTFTKSSESCSSGLGSFLLHCRNAGWVSKDCREKSAVNDHPCRHQRSWWMVMLRNRIFNDVIKILLCNIILRSWLLQVTCIRCCPSFPAFSSGRNLLPVISDCFYALLWLLLRCSLVIFSVRCFKALYAYRETTLYFASSWAYNLHLLCSVSIRWQRTELFILHYREKTIPGKRVYNDASFP